MAAVVASNLPNPFNTTPGPPTCRLESPFSFPEPAELDTISLHTVIQDRSRQTSPAASIFSISSAPPPRNDENLSPLSRFKRAGLLLRASSQPKEHGQDEIKQHVQPRNFSFQPLVVEPDPHENPGSLCRLESSGQAGSVPQENHKISCTEDPGSERYKALHTTPGPSERRTKEQIQENSVAKVRPLNHGHSAMRTPETGMLSRIRELRNESRSREHQDAVQASPLAHHQRLSDGSSGFVHSMKTASMTNASFSIFPRSSRMGRSTDSHFQGSQPRYSIDSDRPLSSCSVDDLATRRGFRRQQIIDELISTEESYVSDLKALIYLYSTLLASASSIPNRLRAAIEQNVADVLHLHERFVSRLHTAKLQAAARRWADTAIPARLVQSRRTHLRFSDQAGPNRGAAIHRHTRSDESGVVVDPSTQQQSLGSAEPVDVYEITKIVKEVVREFSIYEDYCANFESIGGELQKHSPQLWPTFESGMESLARAVMAIDQRQTNDKRGLTVADLLIKPIQRLTKYPLLLEQLLQCTPVADAPDTHAELDMVLQAMRDMVQMVNLAQESPYTRVQIQRRWLLQDRLDFSRVSITKEQFRALGQIELCGILHVAYQTSVAVNGGYALCALLDEHFLVAFPHGTNGRFEAVALIQLSDIKIEASTDGKGLWCSSSRSLTKILQVSNVLRTSSLGKYRLHAPDTTTN